jgi:uncharacterized membrane protein (Fun14 family)
MNMSMIAFVGMAAVAILFLAALVVIELDFKLSALTQSGDSSLGKKSVNWLAAIAFSAAVLICLF